MTRNRNNNSVSVDNSTVTNQGENMATDFDTEVIAVVEQSELAPRNLLEQTIHVDDLLDLTVLRFRSKTDPSMGENMWGYQVGEVDENTVPITDEDQDHKIRNGIEDIRLGKYRILEVGLHSYRTPEQIEQNDDVRNAVWVNGNYTGNTIDLSGVELLPGWTQLSKVDGIWHRDWHVAPREFTKNLTGYGDLTKHEQAFWRHWGVDKVLKALRDGKGIKVMTKRFSPQVRIWIEEWLERIQKDVQTNRTEREALDKQFAQNRSIKGAARSIEAANKKAEAEGRPVQKFVAPEGEYALFDPMGRQTTSKTYSGSAVEALLKTCARNNEYNRGEAKWEVRKVG